MPPTPPIKSSHVLLPSWLLIPRLATDNHDMPPNIGTLKQRLAALSLSPSSPSNYDGDSHKRRHFVPPWKRNVSEPAYTQHEALEDVLSKMIFQAGVDYECVFI